MFGSWVSSPRGVWSGEVDLDVEAAVGAGLDAQLGVVGGGDGCHDRQAEAMAVPVGAVSAQPLEGPPPSRRPKRYVRSEACARSR